MTDAMPLADRVDSRECILLGLPPSGVERAEYVRHLAVGRRTLCHVELGASIPDPPDLDYDDVRNCARCIPS